ncbi:hypothetical protein IG193_01000 [Infirmifilum lucidum]|uniref:Uncharacterized protein n=1 Tax=Infirmifilum lucidum TaxID=2776706 RepID=A0A7L9FJV6_9CREN|nr:hypothetical protein [Infirmifilum lucidum]QOJ79075.1 hypothetical protein IG193_01000 [Infirmifilum lucidum]
MKYQDGVSFLQRRGYRKVGEAVDYEIDLLDFYVPRRILEADTGPATVRRAGREDEDRVLSWIRSEFSVYWEYEAKAVFGYEKPKVWIAEDDTGLIGFAVYSALEPHWFGRFGEVEAEGNRFYPPIQQP